MKVRIVGDDRYSVFLAREFTHFICHGHAANAGAENYDVGHVVSLLLLWYSN
jgi:hypothetical protein